MAWIGWISAAVVLASSGMGVTTASAQESETAANAGKESVNIVVFAMESLRKDAVGAFGASPSATPTFDGLVKESVLFGDCSAASPELSPAVAALLTGASPCELRCWTYRDELDRSLGLLKAAFDRQNIASVAISDSPSFSSMQKAEAGFGELVIRPQVRGNILKRWIRDNSGRPFFAYLHERLPNGFADTTFFTKPDATLPEKAQIEGLGMALEQYRRAVQSDFARGADPGATNASAYVRRALDELEKSKTLAAQCYRDAVREADNRLATVIEALQEEGKWDNTILVVVGLTGVGLGQREGWMTGYSAYQELLAVPALIRFPKGEFGGRRVSEPVSSQDLMPTVFAYAGWIGHATGLQGVSQLPIIRDPASVVATPERVVSIRFDRQNYYRRWSKERGERNIVVRDGPWKLILNSDVESSELYRLDEDPGETNNRVESDSAIAKRLSKLAAEFAQACGETPRDVRKELIESLDPESLRVLREAGVIGENEGKEKP